MAIVISSGCYSDYSFGQVYIALKDFNYLEEAKNCYFKLAEEKYKSKTEDDFYMVVYNNDFEEYLINNGFLGLCDYREIHVGDYDFFDEEEWKEEFLEEKNNE